MGENKNTKNNKYYNLTPKEWDEHFGIINFPFFYNRAIKISWKPFRIKLDYVSDKNKFNPQPFEKLLQNQMSVRYVNYGISRYIIVFFILMVALIGFYVWISIK